MRTAGFPAVWVNTGNILAADTVDATASMSATNNITQYLQAANFNFSPAIPDSAVINGIQIQVRAWRQGSGSIVYATVQLVAAGNLAGLNRSDTSALPTAAGDKLFGGSTDTFGLSLTGINVRASNNFGCVVQYARSASSPTARVDAIWMRVWYTPAQTGASASSGVGTATATATSKRAASGSALGLAVSAVVGRSTAAAVAASPGLAGGTVVGRSLASGTASSAGVGTASSTSTYKVGRAGTSVAGASVDGRGTVTGAGPVISNIKLSLISYQQPGSSNVPSPTTALSLASGLGASAGSGVASAATSTPTSLPPLTLPDSPTMGTDMNAYMAAMEGPTFIDDFDGGTPGATLTAFDRSKWCTHIGQGGPGFLGDGARYLSGNSENQYYGDKQDPAVTPSMPDPFSYGPSVLRITAIPSTNTTSTGTRGHPWLSGCLTSWNLFSQRFGLFEAKMRMSRQSGFWPAFWQLPFTDPTGVNASWPPETDPVEFTRGGLSATTGGTTLQSYKPGRVTVALVRANTCQAGAGNTTTSVILDAGASASTDAYKNQAFMITGGTGVGQTARITGYNGTTKVITLRTAIATPADGTSTFAISGNALGGAGAWTNVGIDLSTSYNVYTMIWTADQTIFYFNGHEYFRINTATNKADMIDQMYPILNLAVGGGVFAPRPADGAVDCVDIDYVKVLQWKGAPPTKPFFTVTAHSQTDGGVMYYFNDGSATAHGPINLSTGPTVFTVDTTNNWTSIRFQHNGGISGSITVDSCVHTDGNTFGPNTMGLTGSITYTHP